MLPKYSLLSLLTVNCLHFITLSFITSYYNYFLNYYLSVFVYLEKRYTSLNYYYYYYY